ncbi:MAG: TetR/AcrR family transcriptional regulator [Pseudomonadota bacterium]
MARPREFQEDEVLDKAMFCFWRSGYEAASIGDLEKATGISRISLYNAFKDKEGLFLAVQARYYEESERQVRKVTSVAKLEPFISFLKSLPESGKQVPGPAMGCLMANTVLDVHTIGQKVLDNLKSYQKMVGDIYEDYIRRCKEAGTIKKDVVPDEAAAFILTSLWGAMAISRLYSDSSSIKTHIDMMIKTIETWKT